MLPKTIIAILNNYFNLTFQLDFLIKFKFQIKCNFLKYSIMIRIIIF